MKKITCENIYIKNSIYNPRKKADQPRSATSYIENHSPNENPLPSLLSCMNDVMKDYEKENLIVLIKINIFPNAISKNRSMFDLNEEYNAMRLKSIWSTSQTVIKNESKGNMYGCVVIPVEHIGAILDTIAWSHSMFFILSEKIGDATWKELFSDFMREGLANETDFLIDFGKVLEIFGNQKVVRFFCDYESTESCIDIFYPMCTRIESISSGALE